VSGYDVEGKLRLLEGLYGIGPGIDLPQVLLVDTAPAIYLADSYRLDGGDLVLRGLDGAVRTVGLEGIQSVRYLEPLTQRDLHGPGLVGGVPDGY
jgi:hypothetical protein